jgi:Protein of unknown function (DUF3455)
MRRALIAGIAGIAAVAAALPLAQAAQAAPAAPAVPGEIAVTGDHKPYMIAHAEGVQIYACYSVADGYAWRLLAPRATLTADNGKPLGLHYGGPTWQALDGSTVVGRRDTGVTVDPTAVDWLRLKADSTTAGPDGDRLTATSYIQRINTVGGLAPAAADCAADTVSQQREVPYSADYVFFKETAETGS